MNRIDLKARLLTTISSAIAFLLLTSCTQAGPAVDFMVEVEVLRQDSRGVSGAVVLLNGHDMGVTGSDGRYVGLIRGVGGQEVELGLDLPEGYFTPEAYTFPKEELQVEDTPGGKMGRGLDFQVKVLTRTLQYALTVNTNEPNRPITVNGERIGETDGAGSALLMVSGTPGEQVTVKIEPASERQLPLGRAIELPGNAEALLLTDEDIWSEEEADDRPAVARPTPARGPLLPPEQRPEGQPAHDPSQVTREDRVAAQAAAREARTHSRQAAEASQAASEAVNTMTLTAPGTPELAQLRENAQKAAEAATRANQAARAASAAARVGDVNTARTHSEEALAAARQSDEFMKAGTAVAERTTPAATAPRPAPSRPADPDGYIASGNQIAREIVQMARRTSTVARDMDRKIKKSRTPSAPALTSASREARTLRSQATSTAQQANQLMSELRAGMPPQRAEDHLDQLRTLQGTASTVLADASSLGDQVNQIIAGRSPATGTASGVAQKRGPAPRSGDLEQVEVGVCDLERLTRSVERDILPAYLVAACEALTEGHPDYSEANFQLARYYRRNRDARREQRALQRATSYGRYRHDPSVLFALIRIAFANNDYNVVLNQRERFLQVHDRLPARQRGNMVGEAYSMFAQSLEHQFYQRHEANPEGRHVELLDRAIEMWEQFRTYTQDNSRANREVAKLRQLREEASR